MNYCYCASCGEQVRCMHGAKSPHVQSMCGTCAGELLVADEE